MEREDLKRKLNVDVAWWEEGCYDDAMVILDKYLDELEEKSKKQIKDLQDYAEALEQECGNYDVDISHLAEQ